jgi:hypothetical protein
LIALRTKALAEWRQMGMPEQLMGVMMDAVSRYHEDELLPAEVRSALGRGIAWGVENLKRDPDLNNRLRYFKTDVKHRPQLQMKRIPVRNH